MATVMAQDIAAGDGRYQTGWADGIAAIAHAGDMVALTESLRHLPEPAALVAQVVALRAALAAFLADGPPEALLDGPTWPDTAHATGYSHPMGTYRAARGLLRGNTVMMTPLP